jgi:hypothetical protein
VGRGLLRPNWQVRGLVCGTSSEIWKFLVLESEEQFGNQETKDIGQSFGPAGLASRKARLQHWRRTTKKSCFLEREGSLWRESRITTKILGMVGLASRKDRRRKESWINFLLGMDMEITIRNRWMLPPTTHLVGGACLSRDLMDGRNETHRQKAWSTDPGRQTTTWNLKTGNGQKHSEAQSKCRRHADVRK